MDRLELVVNESQSHEQRQRRLGVQVLLESVEGCRQFRPWGWRHEARFAQVRLPLLPNGVLLVPKLPWPPVPPSDAGQEDAVHLLDQPEADRQLLQQLEAVL